jgi:dephospho-CoA kinase
MLVVGLTGGIASGKTTVSQMFRDAGVPVICADELARGVVRPGSRALEEIARVFGDQVIGPDGELNRTALAQMVFQDPSRRKSLEAIIHPKVEDERNRHLSDLQREGYELAVVDVPLLYETGLDRSFDVIIVVYVPQQVQEERLEARNHMTREAIRARVDAQMPIDEKKRRADYILDNSGTIEETRRQLDKILEELRYMAARKARRSSPVSGQE